MSDVYDVRLYINGIKVHGRRSKRLINVRRLLLNLAWFQAIILEEGRTTAELGTYNWPMV